MKAFNMALLAKQGWRILTCLSSLEARILKARYFSNSSFLVASLGHNPSYVWRGTLWCREVLSQGLRWRVGGGTLIQAFQDPCIPQPSTFKPISRLPNGGEELLVSDFISAGVWDINQINRYFWVVDKEAILSSPPSTGTRSDILLWHFEKSGCCTLRSGYKTVMRNNLIANSSAEGLDVLCWRRLWKLNVPSKV